MIIETYSLYSLKIRSRSDLVVAKYLADALKQADNTNFAVADDLIKKARGLAPEYFETHRVEATILVAKRDYSAAQCAYEVALELEPNYAPLRKFYGSFLLAQLDDAGKALEQFKLAASLDPKSFVIQIEIARANLYLHEYEQAIKLVETLIGRSDLTNRALRNVYDLYLQCYWRQSDLSIKQGEYDKTITYLARLSEVYEKCPINLRDARMKEKISSATRFARACIRLSDEGDGATKEKAREILKDFERLVPSDKTVGIITKLFKNYGFISTKDGGEIYFRYADLEDPETALHFGAKVKFKTGTNDKGACALEIFLVEESPSTSSQKSEIGQ